MVRELAIDVRYKGQHVAWQRLDMLVDNRIILEIKATEALPPFAKRQLIHYLGVSSFPLGLLLHFGPDPGFIGSSTLKKEYSAATPNGGSGLTNDLANRGIIP